MASVTNQINFTKAALDTLPLPAAGQRASYHDAKTNGLQVRVSSTGVKTFCVFRRIKGGQPERVTLGRYPDMSVEQARRKAAQINAAIAEGDNPAEVRRALRAEPTFTELFAHYGERHGQQKRAWRDDQQRFRDYLEKALGNKKVSTITHDMVARALSDMERLGRSNATINNVRVLASAIFNKGKEWGLVAHNPVEDVPTRKKRSRDRFLQSDELPRFFAALAEEENPTIRDYFLIALLTGARRANVQAMRWDEMNLKEAIWRIPRTKNDDPQNVTLSPEAVEILRARKGNAVPGNRFVFPGEGATGHLVDPKKGWQRLLKRAGLQDLRIHDLRRTLGSWQAKTGASLVIIGKSLNHKSQQATAIYARLDLDPVRQAVNTATAAIFAAAGLETAEHQKAEDNQP